MATCLTLGHETRAAVAIGWLVDGGEVVTPVATFCTECTDTLMASRHFTPTHRGAADVAARLAYLHVMDMSA